MGQGNGDEVTLARVIDAQVKASGMSAAAFRRAIGMTRTTYYRRINGEQPYTVPELFVIAELFGTTMSALVGEAEAAA